MSLKNTITKVWAQIERLFDGMPSNIKTAIHIGVVVTENMKTFIDSPGADILTAIIPGDIDDEIKGWLRAKLPALLCELKLADSCGSLTDLEQITACAIKCLQDKSGDLKSAYLHSLSIFIAQIAADGKLTWHDGVSILEWYYQNEYKASGK